MPKYFLTCDDVLKKSKSVTVSRGMAKKKTKKNVAAAQTNGSATAAAIAKSSKAAAKVDSALAGAPPAKKRKLAPSTPPETAKQVPIPSDSESSNTDSIWTGKPALDLLHGPDFPFVAKAAKALKVVTKIIQELKKRGKGNSLVCEGRTLHYRRIGFELDESTLHTFQHHLFRCFLKHGSIESQHWRKPKHIHTALEAEFFYLNAWNRHAFPELTTSVEVSRLFPPLSSGNTTSMFSVLEADDVMFEALEPRKASRCARLMFLWLVSHVQKTAPDSILLRAATASVGSLSQAQNGSFINIGDNPNQSSQQGEGAVPAAPDRLLTLASTPENFQTALVYTIEAYAADPSSTGEQVKEGVEALLYRLAIKDPMAFPEVFSLTDVRTGAGRGG